MVKRKKSIHFQSAADVCHATSHYMDLRPFKRIMKNITHETDLVNEYAELGGYVKFHIAWLYVDEGVKFKGVFRHFCEDKGVWV